MSSGYFSPYENPRLLDGPDGKYLTERLTNDAIETLQEFSAQEDPFLIYLSFYTVHTPLQAPEDTISKYMDKGSSLRNSKSDFETMEQVWVGEQPPESVA